MNRIANRYASAVRSSNLRSKPETTFSDSDVLGAHGLAAKQRPLAVALQRLFLGDGRQAADVVAIMAQSVCTWAYRRHDIVVPAGECSEIARSVLAWFRDGRCRPCGGHGFLVIPGTRTLDPDRPCQACRGTGRVPFDRQFSTEQLLLAKWLLGEVEREQALAGDAAMRALAPSLNL